MWRRGHQKEGHKLRGKYLLCCVIKLYFVFGTGKLSIDYRSNRSPLFLSVSLPELAWKNVNKLASAHPVIRILVHPPPLFRSCIHPWRGERDSPMSWLRDTPGALCAPLAGAGAGGIVHCHTFYWTEKIKQQPEFLFPQHQQQREGNKL